MQSKLVEQFDVFHFDSSNLSQDKSDLDSGKAEFRATVDLQNEKMDLQNEKMLELNEKVTTDDAELKALHVLVQLLGLGTTAAPKPTASSSFQS